MLYFRRNWLKLAFLAILAYFFEGMKAKFDAIVPNISSVFMCQSINLVSTQIQSLILKKMGAKVLSKAHKKL
tara:strand:+ start:11 stop:226 length:216 start_codon:yes stop_codon:yes gene_type:complete